MALIAAHLNAEVILECDIVERLVYNLPLSPTSIRPSLTSPMVSVDAIKHHERRRRSSFERNKNLMPKAMPPPGNETGLQSLLNILRGETNVHM